MDGEQLFRAVLDEPALPPPPDPPEDDGRGDDGPHIRICMPLVIVHEDGAIATGDWRGTWLVAWHVLTSITTIGLVCHAVIATMLAHATAAAWLVSMALLGAVTLVVMFLGLSGAGALVSRWRARRARG